MEIIGVKGKLDNKTGFTAMFRVWAVNHEEKDWEFISLEVEGQDTVTDFKTARELISMDGCAYHACELLDPGDLYAYIDDQADLWLDMKKEEG